MNPVLQALQFRHACKQFDANKKIPDADFAEIIECARLSPSSFGMEAWKFLVMASEKAKQSIRPACWDQPQITDSSHVVVLVTTPNIVMPGHVHVTNMFNRRGLPAEATTAYLERYAAHHRQEIDPIMSRHAWCAKQSYIALANMMSAAAAMQIDSCPIEGFSKAELEAALGLDGDNEQAAVVVCFGYRAGEQTVQLRRDAAETIEYR